MNWNWGNYIDAIDDFELFDVALIENKDFQNNIIGLKFLYSDKLPDNLIYMPWSNKFFQLTFQGNESISIDKKYLFKIYEDYKNKKKYKSENDNIYEYICYDFMLNLYLSRDSGSGKSDYKKSLKQLIEFIITKGGIVIEEENIRTITELDSFLKKRISNFDNIQSELD